MPEIIKPIMPKNAKIANNQKRNPSTMLEIVPPGKLYVFERVQPVAPKTGLAKNDAATQKKAAIIFLFFVPMFFC